MIKLRPIAMDGSIELDSELNPEVVEILNRTVNFYRSVGFVKPWIGYCAVEGNQVVGTCAFKGAPKEGKVEIAYATLDEFQNRGIGNQMCDRLVKLAISEDATVTINARTLRESGFSTRILEKNGFLKTADIIDHDDTPVWEWTYQAN